MKIMLPIAICMDTILLFYKCGFEYIRCETDLEFSRKLTLILLETMSRTIHLPVNGNHGLEIIVLPDLVDA